MNQSRIPVWVQLEMVRVLVSYQTEEREEGRDEGREEGWFEGLGAFGDGRGFLMFPFRTINCIQYF